VGRCPPDVDKLDPGGGAGSLNWPRVNIGDARILPNATALRPLGCRLFRAVRAGKRSLRRWSMVTRMSGLRGWGWSIGVALVALSCGGDDGGDTGAVGTGIVGTSTGAAESSTGDEPNVLPTVEITANPSTSCRDDGELVLRATRIGCVSPPPAPCTLPTVAKTFEGETVACPSMETSDVMRVELPQTGRYFIDLVHTAADGTETARCYAEDGEAELIIDDERLAANPTIVAEKLGANPCS